MLNLNEAVAGILKLLRRLVGESIELAFRPGPALRNVRIDPSQVDQILANLVVNSRDAIAGAGRIDIATSNAALDEGYCASRTGSVPGEYVMLAIEDDGSGMDKATLGHIFEPFFTTKGEGKGTGLGLATVHGIVRQNSGHIDVRREPGRGSNSASMCRSSTPQTLPPRRQPFRRGLVAMRRFYSSRTRGHS